VVICFSLIPDYLEAEIIIGFSAMTSNVKMGLERFFLGYAQTDQTGASTI